MLTNSFGSGTFQQYWSRRMQRKYYKENVFPVIASMEEEATLKQGDTLNRPYRSALNAQAYTRGTSVTIQDVTTTNETLTVNVAEVVPFYIDDLDALQSNYKFINEFADDAGVKLGNFIDSDILGEYTNASTKVDDASLGGTSGNGITVNASNIQAIFSAAAAKLQRLNLTKDYFAVVSPDFYQKLIDYLAGKNSNLGDSTGVNGHQGKYYGFDIYVSNSLTFTATLAMASTPTNNDTLTIKQYDSNGTLQTITFTFVSTIGTTAGNVLIDGTANSITNLATLINTPGTTTATGVKLSAANQAVLFRCAATAAATSMTLVAKGASFFQLSSSLTATADGWTAAKQVQHSLFGVKGATDLVIQKRPNVEIKEVADKLGKNVLPWTLYGYTTFTEGKAKLVDVQMRTDSLS